MFSGENHEKLLLCFYMSGCICPCFYMYVFKIPVLYVRFKCPFLYVRVPQIEALPISVAKQPFRDLKTHKLSTIDSYRQENVMTVLCAQMVCAVLFVGTTLL